MYKVLDGSTLMVIGEYFTNKAVVLIDEWARDASPGTCKSVTGDSYTRWLGRKHRERGD